MSVPTNLIPTKITGLPEYTGSSQLGYFPYAIDGTMYKVQFSNVASVGEVPPSRTLTAGTGLVGGGDLSANRVFAIANGGVGATQLDTTGVVAGVYGNGSNVPTVTVDANGRVTSVTTSPVVATGYVPEGRLIIAGTGLTGGGSLANNVTLSVNLASATPQALGTATAGVSTAAAREDHVHPAVDLSDTNETQGALPLGRGGTGDALSPVAGAVVYSTGTKFALTSPGIIGQVLTSTGTDEPVWTTITGTGTVTSVNASGGGTGLTFTGGPITTAGTLTLGGTLAVGSGGTGLMGTPANGQLAIGNGSGYTLATLTAGTGVSVTNGVGSITVTNTAPDQIVSLTAGTAISVTGTYPSFTVTNTAPDQIVSLTAGTAISVSGTYPNFTVNNTAPDRIVSLTGAGTTSISGTYPNFTITSNDQFAGTVTSVAASGGTTGLTFSGSPITSAGTLTLGGTLAIGSGGTGASTAGAARTALGAAALGANTDITSIALTSGTIQNAPTSGTDIVNKAYADSIASGINFHQAVRLATVAALPAYTYNNGTGGVGATITANANGALSIDGVAVVAGNRVLIKDEVGGAQAYNGVYVVTQTGSGSTPFILTRATDFDSAGSGVDQIDAGDFFLVTAGNTLANTSWVQQTPLPITVGTTPIIFSQFGAPVLYTAGTGLTLAGTVFSITNTGVSANTYGSASQVPVIAVNAQGQITSANSTSIAISASQITSGVLPVGNGGTGATTFTSNGVLLGSCTSAVTTTAAGATGQVLVGNTGLAPTWATLSSTAVTSFSAGTTGLTPSSPTTGAVTLDGVLKVSNGGTGVTTATGTGSVVLSNSPTLVTPTLGAASATSITNGLGAVGSPSYVFTGDLNTGMWSPGTDTVAFSTNGSERVRVDSSGNVGIGISSPSYRLDVGTGTAVGTTAGNSISISRLSGGAGTNNVALQTTLNRISNGTDWQTTALRVQAQVDLTPFGYIDFLNGSTAAMTFGRATSEFMRIDSSGNVGIGTTSPGATLTVVTNTTSHNGMRVTNNSTTQFAGSGLQMLGPSAAGSQGGAGIYYYNTNVGGTTGALGIAQLDNNGNFQRNLAYYDYNSQFWGFATNNTERMRIDSSGNVGIGTSSPGYRLDVSGVINTNAAVRMIPTNVGAFTRAQLQSAYNLDGTGASVFTWNYTNGGGELDLFINRNGGGTGGLKIYDFPNTSGNPTNIFTVEGGGNVGIGTSSPGARLDVKGLVRSSIGTGTGAGGAGYAFYQFGTSATASENWHIGAEGDGTFRFYNQGFGAGLERMRITSGGEVYIAGTADQGAFNLQCNGTGVWGAGAYVNGSDRNLKEEVAPLADALDVVAALKPVTFRYKEDYSKDQSIQPGFIAQELQEALADQVYVDGVVQAGPKHLNVAYQSLIPVLVKALQEANEKIDTLAARVAQLEGN